MPKVKSYLSQMQSEEAEVKAVSKKIIDRMNETRGRENKGKQEFAKEVGVSFPTWKRWNNNGIGSSDLKTVIVALMRAGYKIEVTPL